MTQAFNLSQLANNLDSTGRLDATDGLVNAVPLANGGTGASTAAAARTNLGVSEASFSIPSGGIIIWSGAQAAIPAGWFLCNGANGTPDLRDRFVIGAGNSYAVAASGGSKDAIVVSHNHTYSGTTTTDPGHKHEESVGVVGTFGTGASYPSIGGYGSAYSGTVDLTNTAGSHSHTFSGTASTTGAAGTNANLPPYYALCYIMKS